MHNNPFTRFDIQHLSCSALNLWRAAPGLWALRYIARISETNPAMWRGNAVEAGLAAMMRGFALDHAVDLARKNFALNADGKSEEEEVAQQAALIEPMLRTLADWTPPSDLAATQLRIETWLDGVPVPLIGYLDFAFESFDIDLKTTERVPSAPRPAHVRQVALYRHARGRPGGVLYASDKKWNFFCVDDEAMHCALAELRADALALTNFLARCNSPRDVLASLPIDWDSFQAPKTRVPFDQLLSAG